MACAEDTWFSRELPVLDAVVTLLDQPGSIMAQVRDMARPQGVARGEACGGPVANT